MKSAKLIICVLSAMFAAINPARAQAHLAGDVPVKVENFIRADSDLHFSTVGLGFDAIVETVLVLVGSRRFTKRLESIGIER
jgi:hypothetical protein